MLNYLSSLLLIVVIVGYSEGLFIKRYQDENDETSRLIKDLQIIYPEEKYVNFQEEFPSVFIAAFSESGQNCEVKFERKQSHRDQSKNTGNIYVIDSNSGQAVKYDLDKLEPYEYYKQSNGHGYATLIRNQVLNKKNPFRMAASVNLSKITDDSTFDILPVVIQSDRKKRNTENEPHVYDSENNHHAIVKREIKSTKPFQDVIDYAVLDESKLAQINNKMKLQGQAKSLNGQPIQLNAEVLAVTDSTVYQSHQIYAGTTDQNKTFAHMRLYYAHLFNGVNSRYVNSLASDPDLRLNVYLRNYLFLTNAADQTWLASNTTYNGKDVVVATPTLSGFRSFLIGKNLSIAYDMAVAFFNKDIWSDDTTQTAAVRTGVAGFAYVGVSCSTSAVGIVEDFGGLSNVVTTAHEMGHNFGSNHDGDSTYAPSCPSSANYIMSPMQQFNNSLNLLRFSSCSISQFKANLLNTNLNGASTSAQCLLNTPTNLPIETSYVGLTYPGQIWTANDQCQQIYGQNASFCPWTSGSMCSSLFCRKDLTINSCTAFPGGAMEGTSCGSGQMCLNGVCTNTTLAPVSPCPFGDDLISQDSATTYGITLPSYLATCKQGIVAAQQANINAATFCIYFGSTCCQSCRKYLALSCKDIYTNCNSFSAYCVGYTFSSGQPVNQACPVTCNNCPAGTNPQKCTDSTYVCQNGGTCVNITSSTMFGYQCNCPVGYTGELCETKVDYCTLNPCQNGGTCVKVGSNGAYECLCAPNYSGYNCSTYSLATTSSVITTTTSTITPTTTTMTTTTTITTTKAPTTTTTITTTTTTTKAPTTTTTTTTTKAPTTTTTTTTTKAPTTTTTTRPSTTTTRTTTTTKTTTTRPSTTTTRTTTTTKSTTTTRTTTTTKITTSTVKKSTTTTKTPTTTK